VPSLQRRGEMLFNDARITYQGWFSCASCHQEDATMDGLNWDLPNDGTGNPKNAKSLHDIADTPPAMWSGVREDMPEAVAAGQRFMGFLPRPEQHGSLLAYLGTIERAPNPWRAQDAAVLLRGERAFQVAGCATCHPPPLYTDLQKYDLGLSTPDDYEPMFDTPSLRECYRTAPYLHDGRARTLRELWTVHDPKGTHGSVAALPAGEFEDMLAFLRSL
jgi:cytochrome c peroxidase